MDDEYNPDDSDDDTTECPYCRRAIFDDALQCPHCGNYLSTEDAPRQPMPIWLVIGFILAFLVALLWIWPI